MAKTDNVSKRIMVIREAAGGGGPLCPSCRQPRATPYRCKDDRGYIVGGCIDASHSGHVYNADLAWHTRAEAKAMRERELERALEVTRASA